MAANVYGGVMGSGKSFEVVSGPLLDAVAVGRRVVTNIDGINEAEIHAYLVRKRSLPVDKLGAVVYVRTEDMLKPGFFPVEVESAHGATVTPGFVQAGDMVAVDEAWKFWSTSDKISKEHMSFFRMHRHFAHPDTGVTCDIVIMIQSVADLNRSIKAVIELSFRTVKLKSLGLSSRYRLEMYETAKQTKSTCTGTFVRKYSPEIFPLYKSYAGGVGKEVVIDKRQNVLRRSWIWVTLAIGVVAVPASVVYVYRYLHPQPKAHKVVVGSAAVGAAQGGSGAAAIAPDAPVFSDTWRVVGGYRADGLSWVVVADSGGRLRVASPAEFMGAGIFRVGTVDGVKVSTWSGALHAAAANSGVASK